ncbi:MAG: PKD domain-containing protein [Candidatus Promineifilaceae bacterium]
MEKKWAFPIIGLALILLVAVAVLVGAASAGDTPLLSFLPARNLQETGAINLTMSVTPQSTTPGETVNLELLVSSGGSEAAIPEIQITIPNKLSFSSKDLPSGASFNFQANTISWEPVVPAGSSSRLLVPLSVDVAELHEPVQAITALLVDGQNQQEYSTPLWIGTLPQVFIVFDPPQVAVGQPVQIRANISGPGPFTQYWSLGDGRVLDVNDPVVVFPTATTYQVSVDVSNPLGKVSASSLISVVPAPVARFSLDDATPAVNQMVTFTNESGGEGLIVHTWDFGDGTTSQEPTPTHAYTNPGSYQVTLKVENEYGQSETSQVVTVGQQPVADIVMVESAVAGTMINAQAFTDDSVTTISWDMGDGRTYEGPNINHVYWRAGDYTVTMMASNDYDSFQVTHLIHIEAGALAMYLPIVRKGGESDASSGIETNVLDPTRPEATEETPAERQTLVPYEFPPNMSQEEKLLAYLNQARDMNGLPPVSFNATVALAAQEHTIDMASNGFGGIPGTPEFTPHTGSDGSSPALRLQRTGYQGGYGAEATAWGFQTAIEAVEFWLNNPPHRRILLNPYVDEVGVAYARNLDAPNIWYWTAVFASMSLPVVHVPEVVPTAPPATPTPVGVLTLLGPPQNSEFALITNNNLIFSWSWTASLDAGQRFVVYLKSGRTFQIGAVQESLGNNQYQFKTAVTNVPVSPGLYEWQVRLEDLRTGEVLEESPFWPVQFLSAAEATPIPTSEGAEATPTAESTTTPEPTATP